MMSLICFLTLSGVMPWAALYSICFSRRRPVSAKAVAISRVGGRDVAGARRDGPRKPALDEMGPGPDKVSKPYRAGPRSTTGRAGMRGGWRPRGR